MQPSPRVFHYSLDWRFLLPIADARNVGLLLENDPDFRDALGQVGLQASRQLSLSDLRQTKTNQMHTLVMPFGLPKGWAGPSHKDQLELYSLLHRRLVSEGYLLVGFNNAWRFEAGSQTRYHASTPRRMTGQLKQAGFHSIETFGAMRNLSIPEYIFHLEPRAIEFALQNRFRRKPAILRTLRMMASTMGLARLSGFLPCYFVVATA